MNVAKWLLIALLALPMAELTAFVVVAVIVGLAWALLAQVACSFAGLLVLRHAGGTHVSRVRAALDEGRVTALSADGTGALTLLAGILLLIPGFITDLVGLVLLLGSNFGGGQSPAASDGVIDLEREQWRHMDDPALPNRRRDRDDKR
jgi:UPF0716 protein FxsA